MLSKNATCYPESHIPGFIYMPGLTAMICLQHFIIRVIQNHTVVLIYYSLLLLLVCISLELLHFNHDEFKSFTVIVGEIANFAAYAYAPAILVTPLGALSIIFR